MIVTRSGGTPSIAGTAHLASGAWVIGSVTIGALARADFFGREFGPDESGPVDLHRRSVRALRAEAAEWDDLGPAAPA